MLNIIELENRWLRYKIKSYFPYFIITIVLIITTSLLFSSSKNQTLEKKLPPKKEPVQKIIKPEKNIQIKHKSMMLSPSLDFINKELNSTHSAMKQKMLDLYQKRAYEDVCQIGFDYFKKNKRDEEFVSLYAFSCLNADYIDRLAAATAVLKFSKKARANSAYFSLILMQKKLLYHALVDNYSLSSFKLPSTDYVLSRVFELYSKLEEHNTHTFYLFEDPLNPKIRYKLYLSLKSKRKKMIIEEFYDTSSIKRHIYW